MNTDFRISVGFFSHPKTRRLRRRHGDAAVISLLRLWEFAAMHRMKGVLHDMEAEDIIDVSGWPGDTEFVDSLHSFGFLDVVEGWYELHDWRDHNGWCYYADERSELARKAAKAKWLGEKKKEGKSSA